MNPEMIGTIRKETIATGSPSMVLCIHWELKAGTVEGRTSARIKLNTSGTNSGLGVRSLIENLDAIMIVLQASKL